MSQMIKFEKACRSGDVCERVKIVHRVDVVNFNVALNDKDFSSSYSFTGISHFKSFYGHSFKWKIYKLNMKSMCRNLRISQEIKFYLLFFLSSRSHSLSRICMTHRTVGHILIYRHMSRAALEKKVDGGAYEELGRDNWEGFYE